MIKLTKLLLEIDKTDPGIQKLQAMLKKDYESFVGELNDKIKDPEIRNAILSGFEDGRSDDDRLPIEKVNVKVSQLRPTQNEIDLTKSLLFPLQKVPILTEYYLNSSINILIAKTPILILNEKYIIDGHHRWSQVICFNTKASMVAFNIRTSKNPLDVLKAIQLAIAAKLNEVPTENTQGTNLFKVQEQEFKNFVSSTISKETIQIFNSKLGLKNVDSISHYLWGNVKYMKTNCVPILGAPDRDFMPQTDTVKGLYKDLKSGEINFEAPFYENKISLVKLIQ